MPRQINPKSKEKYARSKSRNVLRREYEKRNGHKMPMTGSWAESLAAARERQEV